MSRINSITQFVDALIRAEMPSDRLINIYRNPIRKRNLFRWMDRAPGHEPRALFIGEAPGRFGAATTGVPFASIDIIESLNINQIEAFATHSPFETPSARPQRAREATSSFFWDAISQNFNGLQLPTTWNVVPFWPTKSSDDGVRANRKPTASEMSFGAQWLVRYIELHPSATPVAVGRSAEKALTSLGVEHHAVRHPSFGGKINFFKGIESVANALKS